MTADRRVPAQQTGGVTPAGSQPATAAAEPEHDSPPGGNPGPADTTAGGPPRGYTPDADDRPGDPVCLLRRVCPACGSVADEDPPTICPRCHQPIIMD